VYIYIYIYIHTHTHTYILQSWCVREIHHINYGLMVSTVHVFCELLGLMINSLVS